MEVPTVALSDVLTGKTYRPFRTAAVLGAGVMGAQIAAHLANIGLQVHLLDIAAEGPNKNAIVEKNFKRAQKLKPSPLFTEKVVRRIKLGNFDEHFDRVGEVDWIIEAVIERLDIKQQVMARVEEVAREDAVISTNTSGLPLHRIAEGRSESFRQRFLGTHFFNPPRYLKLLEIIPLPDTRRDVLERVVWFGRLHLGKGIVIAKDTPNFIANRIGVYAMMLAMQAVLRGEYTIEEIDALTGPLIGHPKSATFRTADLVGLDTLIHVAENLYENVPHDESRDVFKVPEVLKKMVEKGLLGAKSGAGFYKKVDGKIYSINLETLEYEPPEPINLERLERYQQIEDLRERFKALYEDKGRIGKFIRWHTLNTLGYSARRIPEITERPADIDRAMQWGFGWKLGPFETWDVLGFDRVIQDAEAEQVVIPDWVLEMPRMDARSFYRGEGPTRESFVYGKGYQPDAPPPDEISLAYIKKDPERTLWENPETGILDMGDGVLLLEFRSKANAIGRMVIEGMNQAIDMVEEGDYRGLIIGNEGDHFSVGANLLEVAMAAQQGAFDQIEQMVHAFQKVCQRIYYAAKPVVVAVHQRALGGGCEVTMASPYPVAAAESYIGLVELGVGLIPAGGGCMRMSARAHERAPTEHPSHVAPYLRNAFETIAMARVALSAREAQELGFLPDHAPVVMNDARRFFVAKQEVIRLFEQGYAPPPYRNAILVLGATARAQFEAGVYNLYQGRFISEYDRYLASRLAYVLTGGDITAPSFVTEDYLLDLEREVFMSLLGEQKTQERIMHMLMHRKPLRN